MRYGARFDVKAATHGAVPYTVPFRIQFERTYTVSRLSRTGCLGAVLMNGADGVRSSQEKNITNIIIIIIMVVVLCHTPDRVLTVFKAIQKPENKHCPDPLIYASHLCNLLIVVNSSANFVIYVLFRRRFRRILRGLVCRGGDWRHELALMSPRSPTSPEQTSLRSWPGSFHRHSRSRCNPHDNDGHVNGGGRTASASGRRLADHHGPRPTGTSDASMTSDARADDELAMVTFHIGPT